MGDKNQIETGGRAACVGVMLGYQGFMARGGDLDMDVGQAADVICRAVTLEGVPASPIRTYLGPMCFIIIPLRVGQPEFQDGARQGTTRLDRPHGAFKEIPLANTCSERGIGAVKWAHFIMGGRAAVTGDFCRLVLTG